MQRTEDNQITIERQFQQQSTQDSNNQYKYQNLGRHMFASVLSDYFERMTSELKFKNQQVTKLLHLIVNRDYTYCSNHQLSLALYDIDETSNSIQTQSKQKVQIFTQRTMAIEQIISKFKNDLFQHQIQMEQMLQKIKSQKEKRIKNIQRRQKNKIPLSQNQNDDDYSALQIKKENQDRQRKEQNQKSRESKKLGSHQNSQLLDMPIKLWDQEIKVQTKVNPKIPKRFQSCMKRFNTSLARQ